VSVYGACGAVYALVRFDSDVECDRVIAEFYGTRLDGRPVRLMRSELASVMNSELWVFGFDESLEENQIMQAFSTYGLVVSVRLGRDEAGRSLGFGCVEFRDAECAAQAKELAGAAIDGNDMVFIDPPVFGLERLIPRLFFGDVNLALW
jgi:polyadenylate-binding protein